MKGARRSTAPLGSKATWKNDLLLRAFGHLGDRAMLWLFGVEPHVGREAGARYVYCPSDAEVAGLYQRASVFALTSRSR